MKMKKIAKNLMMLGVATFLIAGNALAYNFGDEITAFDESARSGWGNYTAWWNSQDEDQETEYYTEIGQAWDLEAFFLEGTDLTMVGGYDFKNGYHTTTSGDIFIDVDGDMIYGQDVISFGSDGNKEMANIFGYDYVLDMNFETSSYDVYSIDESATLLTGYYRSNDKTGAWGYAGGGQAISADNMFSYQTGLSDSDVGGLAGGTHNAVGGIDLSFLSSDIPVDFAVHFTMSCSNDNLIGLGTLAADSGGGGGGSAATPEPATMFLLGCGMIGLALLRKKFDKKN